MLNEKITVSVDLLCICYLTFNRVLKTRFKHTSENARMRNLVMYAACVYQFILLVVTFVGYYTNPFSYFIRPVIAIVFLSNVRARFLDIFTFLKDTCIVLMAIFGYVLFSSTLFYTMFKSTFQGSSTFPTLGDTYYQLLILLTTANFPDVMLPAYNVYYLYAWFFVVYFIVAFYFLLNILLANVFNMFRMRLEAKASTRIQARIHMIAKYLN